jgi:hyaluronoglucosaminidase
VTTSPGVVVVRTTAPAFQQVGVPPAGTDEHYLLTVAEGPRFELTCSSDRGERWGRAHVADLLRTGRLQPASYDEHPGFPVRGVVEGFYGTPWTHEQRRDMIRFLAGRRMNTFVYSPKDDAHTRRRWRDPYPDDELHELAATVAVANEAGVTVSYGVSPGLSIRYSDRAEADRVVARFDEVAAVGVRDLVLLLDDIPDVLLHRADRDSYPDLVTAQLDLIDRVRGLLDQRDPRIGLTVCPTLYHGRGDEPYLRALGQGTDPRVDLLWTGRAICSPELDLADAASFTRTTSRPVLYWDNYPVNDVAMTAELHLGAYRGRDPHLFRFSRGVVANPMELPEASKVALATIADYLWDPVGYDPEASWRAAAELVAGADAEALLCFADNVRSSCLEEADALVLGAALERAEFEAQFGDPDSGREGVRAVANRFLAAADQLLGPTAANPALVAEIQPWLLRFRAGAVDLLALLDGDPQAVGDGAPEPPRVFGDVLDMFVRSRPGWIDSTGGHPQTNRK